MNRLFKSILSSIFVLSLGLGGINIAHAGLSQDCSSPGPNYAGVCKEINIVRNDLRNFKPPVFSEKYFAGFTPQSDSGFNYNQPASTSPAPQEDSTWFGSGGSDDSSGAW